MDHFSMFRTFATLEIFLKHKMCSRAEASLRAEDENN